MKKLENQFSAVLLGIQLCINRFTLIQTETKFLESPVLKKAHKERETWLKEKLQDARLLLDELCEGMNNCDIVDDREDRLLKRIVKEVELTKQGEELTHFVSLTEYQEFLNWKKGITENPTLDLDKPETKKVVKK